jgi:hypothetical protein
MREDKKPLSPARQPKAALILSADAKIGSANFSLRRVLRYHEST